MAKGPFASSGNQASEIEGVRQVGGAASVDDTAGTIAALANIIVPAVRENRTKELKDEVTQHTADVKSFLKLARNPELLTSDFGVDAVENPAVRQALADFVKVRDSRDQGILPSQFALERLEVIQNDAIANAPEFEQEIRMAMTAATGQDPAKTLFAQLLRPQAAAGKTDAEKAESRLQIQMIELGLTREEIVAGGRIKFNNQMRKDQFEINKRNNVVEIQDIASESVKRAGESYGALLEILQREKEATGGIHPDTGANFLTQVRLEKIKVRAAIMKGLNGRLDAKAIEDAMGPLDKWEADLTYIVENNLTETLIANRVALKQQMIIGSIMNNADDAAALTIGGKEGFLAMKKFLNENDNPTMARLQQALFDDAANAASLRTAAKGGASGSVVSPNRSFGMPSNAMLMNQYANISDGRFDELSAQQKTARRMASNVILRTPKADPQAIAGAIDTLRDGYGWKAIQHRDVVATAMAHPAVAKRVIALQTFETGALAFEYETELSKYNGFVPNHLKIIDGQLVYDEGKHTASRDKSEAALNVPGFVARFNRALAVSKQYSRVGILPDSKYTNPEAYLETIRTAVKKQQKEGKPVVKPKVNRTFVRDADGNIVLGGD